MQRIQEKLRKRQEELERKRQERQESKLVLEQTEENSASFQKHFQSLQKSIESKFNDIKSKEEKRKEDFQVIYDEIKELSNYTSESYYFLNSYEQTQANDKIQDLLSSVQNYERSLFQKKISFRELNKNRKNTKNINALLSKINSNEQKDQNVVEKQEQQQEFNDQILTEYNQDQDLQLHHYKHSIIYIKNILLSVSLKNVSDSVIIFTHIDGSIYIENCHRCLFLLRGKQIRIHDSDNVHFSLFIVNNPIIENSTHLFFSSLLEQYQLNIHDSLSQYKNSYHQVKDFNWLKNTPSPNFKVLNEGKELILHEDPSFDLQSHHVLVDPQQLDDLGYVYSVLRDCLHVLQCESLE